MSDRIIVRGLCVETRIGVTEQERSRPQDVIVDIEIATDLGPSGKSDDLNDTIDYDTLVTQVAALVRGSEYNLLETLATKIADEVSGKPGVGGVTVQVQKRHAPVDEEVSGISVHIERGSLG